MAEIEFSFGGYKGETSVHAEAALRFGQLLKDKLGDRLAYRMLSDTDVQGQGSGDLLAQVADGNLDFCYIASVRFASVVPEFVLFDLPFIAEDRPALFKALDGELGDFYRRALEKATPFKLLGFWDNGLRHVSNRVRPLNTLADCEGLAVRTQLSDAIGDVFRAAGFIPKPLDIKLYRQQMDRRDIDAQDNDLPTIYNFGIHKHHRYVTLTGHILGILVVICSKAAFNAWPKEVQTAVIDSMNETCDFQHRRSMERDEEAVALLRDDGAEVNALSPGAAAAFREAVRPMFEKYRPVFKAPVFDAFLP